MLAQVSRQILNAFAQLPVFPDPGMLQVEADLLKMIFKIVGGTSPFATVDNASKLVERLLIEPKCFANFSRGGTVAIGDDVRRHRSTELAVSLIHILNCFF